MPVIMTLRPTPFPKSCIRVILDQHEIMVNHYAREYFAHPGFVTEQAEETILTIVSLREIGLEHGATLAEISRQIEKKGFLPCLANTGLFLRLVWKHQQQSNNSILTGTHDAPDQAVMVFSELLERDDAFPKGLYLCNVNGQLWLRGYTCDSLYRFPADAMFAIGMPNTYGQSQNEGT